VIEILCGGKAHRHRGVTHYGAVPPHIGARHINAHMCRDTYAHSGHLFVFRGKRADRIKILWWDGTGLCLYAKRLERGRFVWPLTREGAAILTPAQLSMLCEGIDWRTPVRTDAAMRAG
jgi:transposase